MPSILTRLIRRLGIRRITAFARASNIHGRKKINGSFGSSTRSRIYVRRGRNSRTERSRIMSISNATETAILKLIYQAVAWANYADNAAASPQTNVTNALHSGDPADAGTQTTSEVTYTSYTRVDVARSTTGWSEANGTVTPVSNIDFPAGTGGGGTASFWSTGKTGGGASAILWSGTVSPAIALGSGVTPRLTTASTITLD